MFHQPFLVPWARLFASLALEVILVFAFAALLARLIRPASGQRMVWRVSFVVLGALVLAEFSGVGHSLVQHTRPSPTAPAPPRTFVVTTSLAGDSPPISSRVPTGASVPVAPVTPPETNLRSALASWLPLLALGGLVWFGGRRGLGALRLIRLGRTASCDSGDLAARVQRLCHRLGIRRHVGVKLIEGLSSPIAFGVFRPAVGVPMDFSARFAGAQQEAMLAHELAHVAAFDAVWMLLADLVTALLWWHPGAWWARRSLRAASETAADEASLLLEDGPATLAECLVTLGDLLTRSPDPGGLGMAGFRFRSELGRRVERLLHLRESSRPPWRSATAWLARLLVPAALVSLALAVTAWLLPPAAQAATVGEAFQRSPLGLATKALLIADKQPKLSYSGKVPYDPEQFDAAEANDASMLLLQGKQLYDAGKTNQAEAKWRSALELDPGNKVALDYLARIGHTNFSAAKPAVPPTAPPIPQPRTGTNLAYMSNGRQKIYQKLNSIRLVSVMFDDVPLTQALDQIRKEAKKRDADKKGIYIIINSTADPQAAAPAIDAATGLQMAGSGSLRLSNRERPAIDPTTSLPVAAAEGDFNATTVTINPELHDVTLGQVFDLIVKVADRPIKYSVEDFGVIFSLRSAEPLVLHTRWYKIDPNTLMRGLQEATARDFGTNKVPVLGDLPYIGKLYRTTPSPSEIDGDSIRTYFRSKGVNLDPPKSLIFGDRLGMLMVRATLADLDVIEQAVQVLNTVPPQVHIEVKFCEVPEELLAAPGLKLQPVATATNAAGTNATPATLTSILTPGQSLKVLQALRQWNDVTFLPAPNVTTPTDRQAQVKTVEVRNIVTGFDAATNAPDPANPPPITQTFEFGPVVDVVPHVEADRQTIFMRVIAGLKEFVGYDLSGDNDLWDYVESKGANPAPQRPPPKPPRPIIRERQAIASATLWDGQTLVLASRDMRLKSTKLMRLTDLPEALVKDLLRRGFGSKDTQKRALLVFVTPMIIDPAGNVINTDAELPARTNSVPSQSPPPRVQ